MGRRPARWYVYNIGMLFNTSTRTSAQMLSSLKILARVKIRGPNDVSANGVVCS